MSDEPQNPFREPFKVIVLGLPVALVLYSPIGAFMAAWQAWVLFKLWQWFIPPDIAAARFTIAFGVVLMVQLLTFRPRRTPLTNENRIRAIGDQVLWPILTLGIGWVGTLLFGQV